MSANDYQAIAGKMRQTFEVSGDKWFKAAADMIIAQGDALKQIAEDDPSGKWGRWAREALSSQERGAKS